MQNLKIKNWDKEEIKEISSLICRNFSSYKQSMDKEYSNPLISGKIAVLNDKIVGFILYQTLTEEAEIHLVVVENEFRKLGIGKALIVNTLAEMRKNGIKYLFLEVSESNSLAIKLYEKLGFKQIGIRENYYGKGNNGIVMMLKIETKEVKDVQRRKPKRTGKEKVPPLCNS